MTKQEALERIEELKRFIEQDDTKGKLCIGQWVMQFDNREIAYKIMDDKEVEQYNNNKLVTLKDFIWNLAPDDAAGYAVDNDGGLYFYTEKPEEEGGFYAGIHACNNNDDIYKIYTPETIEMAKDWQNSWTPRPDGE